MTIGVFFCLIRNEIIIQTSQSKVTQSSFGRLEGREVSNHKHHHHHHHHHHPSGIEGGDQSSWTINMTIRPNWDLSSRPQAGEETMIKITIKIMIQMKSMMKNEDNLDGNQIIRPNSNDSLRSQPGGETMIKIMIQIRIKMTR